MFILLDDEEGGGKRLVMVAHEVAMRWRVSIDGDRKVNHVVMEGTVPLQY